MGTNPLILGWTGDVVVKFGSFIVVDICCPVRLGMMVAMITSLRRFNPIKDTELATLRSEPDGQGRTPDIDTMLYHSEKHGFYLVRRIAQIRRNGIWQTGDDSEECLSVPRRHRRCLTTVRPLNRAQMIRLILESYLPEEEGAKGAVLKVLSSAGII